MANKAGQRLKLPQAATERAASREPKGACSSPRYTMDLGVGRKSIELLFAFRVLHAAAAVSEGHGALGHFRVEPVESQSNLGGVLPEGR